MNNYDDQHTKARQALLGNDDTSESDTSSEPFAKSKHETKRGVNGTSLPTDRSSSTDSLDPNERKKAQQELQRGKDTPQQSAESATSNMNTEHVSGDEVSIRRSTQKSNKHNRGKSIEQDESGTSTDEEDTSPVDALHTEEERTEEETRASDNHQVDDVPKKQPDASVTDKQQTVSGYAVADGFDTNTTGADSHSETVEQESSSAKIGLPYNPLAKKTIQKNRTTPVNSNTPQKKQTLSMWIGMIISAGVLFIISIVLFVGFGYTTLFVANEQDNVPKLRIPQNLIASGEAEPLVLDITDQSQLVANLIKHRQGYTPLAEDDIRVVPLIRSRQSTEQIPVRELMSKMVPSMPDQLTRTLQNKYVYGYIGARKIPYMVLTVHDHNRAFASMLAWESRMYTDLSPVFTQNISDMPSSPSSVSGMFQDQLVDNNDVRVLRHNGDPILTYMFIEPTILMIAPDVTTLRNLIQARRTAQKEIVN